jgi:atlastin
LRVSQEFDDFVMYQAAKDWLEKCDRPLEGGFHWRGGVKPDTTGILMWSEPFFIQIPSGEMVKKLIF